MSACSSGGVLDSSISGFCSVPRMFTRASTPWMMRRVRMSSLGLISSKPSNRTVPSRRISNRRPWKS